MTKRHETDILRDVPTGQRDVDPETARIARIHKSPLAAGQSKTVHYSSPTVAYSNKDSLDPQDHNRTWSKVIPLNSDPTKTYLGASLIDNQPITDASANMFLTTTLQSVLRGRGQNAFGVSLHYKYPNANNRSSGHTLGFFYSPGGIGNRKAGVRFFDPNAGTWQFAGPALALQFFISDWLDNFKKGTGPSDPGAATPGAVNNRVRNMDFIRLVAIRPN